MLDCEQTNNHDEESSNQPSVLTDGPKAKIKANEREDWAFQNIGRIIINPYTAEFSGTMRRATAGSVGAPQQSSAEFFSN